MNNKKYMNISEFAKISGTTRRNLLFYDEIGLFSPAKVGDNGYRYYTIQQFYNLDIINILKTVGMPLKAIKEFLQTRTPKKAIELFSKQDQEILAEIERLTYYHKALQTHIWRIKQAATFDLDKLTLQKCPTEYFLASKSFNDSEDAHTMKVYFDFFSTLNMQRLDIGYPMSGVIYSNDGFLDATLDHENKMLQKISKKEAQRYKSSDILKKPAGYYLAEFRNDEQGRAEILTNKMKEYLFENDLQIEGPLWELWWQDETTTMNPSEYIYQISIRIKKN